MLDSELITPSVNDKPALSMDTAGYIGSSALGHHHEDDNFLATSEDNDGKVDATW